MIYKTFVFYYFFFLLFTSPDPGSDLSPQYKLHTQVPVQCHTDLGADAPLSHRKRTHRQSPDPTVPKVSL